MNSETITLLIGAIVIWLIERLIFNWKRKLRQNWYRNVYLESDSWKKKRYVVLKRDNWKCTYCGAKATEVHHKKYLKKNLGKEPIKWLVSICRTCHDKKHQKFRFKI